MLCDFDDAPLADDDDWDALLAEIDPKDASSIARNVLARFREAGAVFYIEESTYIDRDFSAAYAAFYSTLYNMRPRYCRRFHFFASTMDEYQAAEDVLAASLGLEGRRGDYCGYLIVRPLAHAPVGSAVVSAPHLRAPGVEISVRAEYRVHLLGAELVVEGAPVTEQDKRTGSCAQATIWTAGRHFHTRHSMPWFSLPEITEAALKPTDSMLARSLPAGADFLTDDNMVRALRAMGEHPIVYGPEPDDEEEGATAADAHAAGAGRRRRAAVKPANTWNPTPQRTIGRYLDSGIPVIIGLKKGERVGHAVVAVGTVSGSDAGWSDGVANPNVADRITHVIVNDDQRGTYERLPVAPMPSPGKDDYSLDDTIFIMVPLPSKVYLKAEAAETLARDKIRYIMNHRDEHLLEARDDVDPADWSVDPDFYAADPGRLVARTYLTHGWKYKHRLVRNAVAEELKQELTYVQLPRYVWVTEFSLPGDVEDADPCRRRVRAHAVVDATGSKHDDPVLLAHTPGIVVSQSFDPDLPSEPTSIVVWALLQDTPYYPKVRGWRSYDACETGASGDAPAAPPTDGLPGGATG